MQYKDFNWKSIARLLGRELIKATDKEALMNTHNPAVWLCVYNNGGEFNLYLRPKAFKDRARPGDEYTSVLDYSIPFESFRFGTISSETFAYRIHCALVGLAINYETDYAAGFFDDLAPCLIF